MTKDAKTTILVLCTGNSCRSQMAEGWLRFFAGERAVVYSAGIEAHGLNQNAVEVMKETGIDISSHTSKTIDHLEGIKFDIVLTVCDNAREHCPYFPAGVMQLHKDFHDPALAVGTKEQVLQVFRSVRDEIKVFCQALVILHLKEKPPPP